MIIVCEILRLWEVSDNPITQSFYVSELQIKHSLSDSRICELNYYAVITILYQIQNYRMEPTSIPNFA